MAQSWRQSDNHMYEIVPNNKNKSPDERKRISYKSLCFNSIRDLERRMHYVERLYAECYPEEMRKGSEKFNALHEAFYDYKERSSNQIIQLKRRISKLEEKGNLHDKNISRLQNEVLYNEKIYTQYMRRVTYMAYIVAVCIGIVGLLAIYILWRSRGIS